MTGERREFQERYANNENEYPDSNQKLESNMIAEKLLTEHRKENQDWDYTNVANDYFTQRLLKEFNLRNPKILRELTAPIEPQADFNRAPLLDIENTSGAPVEYRNLNYMFREAMTAYTDTMSDAEEQPRENLSYQFAQLLTHPVSMASEETGIHELIDRTKHAQDNLATRLYTQEPQTIVQAVQEPDAIRREIRETRG